MMIRAMGSQASKTNQGGEPNRKEKKKKLNERQKIVWTESGNTVAISSSSTAWYTQHWIHPVWKCCHFSKSYRTAYKHFPFHRTPNSTYIRVLQTERSLNGDWCGFSSIESERASAKETTKVAVAISKFRMALYYFTLVRGNGVGELRVLFTVQYRRQLDNKIYVYTYTNVMFK